MVRQLGAAADVELSVDRGEVALHGLVGDPQRVADLAVALAERGEPGDIALASREVLEAGTVVVPRLDLDQKHARQRGQARAQGGRARNRDLIRELRAPAPNALTCPTQELGESLGGGFEDRREGRSHVGVVAFVLDQNDHLADLLRAPQCRERAKGR